MYGKRNQYKRSCALRNLDYDTVVKNTQACGFDSKSAHALS